MDLNVLAVTVVCGQLAAYLIVLTAAKAVEEGRTLNFGLLEKVVSWISMIVGCSVFMGLVFGGIYAVGVLAAWIATRLIAGQLVSQRVSHTIATGRQEQCPVVLSK